MPVPRSLRRQQDALDPLVGARLGRLGLRARPSGWVPDDDSEPVDPLASDLGCGREPSRVPHQEQPASGWVPTNPADQPPLRPAPPAAGGDLAAPLSLLGAAMIDRLPPALRALRLGIDRRGAFAVAGVALLAVLLTGGLLLRSRPQPVEAPPVVPSPAPAAATPVASVVVDVAGRVRRPGVVTLAQGSRVGDALRAAGGPLRPADVGRLNLARKLTDGEQILVGVPPTSNSGPAGSPVASSAADSLVDLNNATAAQLDALPGVGPVLSRRIVEWRDAHGRFASVDQLREVDGIGERRFDELRPLVRV